MALALVYYLRALYQLRGAVLLSGQRIDSVDVGQTLNSNVLCFLAVIFSILSLILYEIWCLSLHKRSGPVVWWRLILLFFILLHKKYRLYFLLYRFYSSM